MGGDLLRPLKGAPERVCAQRQQAFMVCLSQWPKISLRDCSGTVYSCKRPRDYTVLRLSPSSCTVGEHLLSPRSSVNLVSTVPELCSVACSQQFPKGHDHHHIAFFGSVWSIIDAQLIENGRVVALCNQ